MVVAVILAAGSSTRMGKPKLVLPVEGKPVLQRVLEAVRKSRAEGSVVVLGANEDEIRKKVRFHGEKVVVNRRPSDGMSSSLRLGVESVGKDTDAVMVVLGDMPLLSVDTLDRLIGAYDASKAKVVIPTCLGRRGNPVIIDRRLFQQLMKLHGDVGAKSVIAANEVSVLEVPVDDNGVLADVDDPADYQRLRRLSRE